MARDVAATDPRVREAYERWSGEIRSFLVGLTRNGEQAEECLQATFSRLVEAGDAAGTTSLRGWLFRVAHNEAMLARRKAGVRRRGLWRAWLAADRDGRLEATPPWAAIVQAEDVARVRAALAALPAEQRRVVEERIYEGKTFAAIAKETATPLGTVLTRMRSAQSALRRALRRE
jgi:RNA polymerase sigma-70 factor (ECF subfamily)